MLVRLRGRHADSRIILQRFLQCVQTTPHVLCGLAQDARFVATQAHSRSNRSGYFFARTSHSSATVAINGPFANGPHQQQDCAPSAPLRWHCVDLDGTALSQQSDAKKTFHRKPDRLVFENERWRVTARSRLDELHAIHELCWFNANSRKGQKLEHPHTAVAIVVYPTSPVHVTWK